MRRREFVRLSGLATAVGVVRVSSPSVTEGANESDLAEWSSLSPEQGASDETFWQRVRALYTPPAGVRDFDNANAGAVPASVVATYVKNVRDLNGAPNLHYPRLNSFEDSYERLAALLDTTVDEIALLPVREVCAAARARDVAVVVDAAQSIGYLDISVRTWGCDFVAASLHKGMGAPLATGVLAMRKEWFGRVEPLHPPTWDFSKYPIEQYAWTGTANVAASASLAERPVAQLWLFVVCHRRVPVVRGRRSPAQGLPHHRAGQGVTPAPPLRQRRAGVAPAVCHHARARPAGQRDSHHGARLAPKDAPRATSSNLRRRSGRYDGDERSTQRVHDHRTLPSPYA